MLKYYTEPSESILLAGVPLIPLVGAQFNSNRGVRDSDLPWKNKYDEFWEASFDIVQSVSLHEADVVVLPYDWFWYRGTSWLSSRRSELAAAILEKNRNLYDVACRAGKPAILFFSGERSHEPTPFPEAITFRRGMYASKGGFRDFCLPAFGEDIAMQIPADTAGVRSGALVLRDRNPIPTIGFCGLAPRPALHERVEDVLYFALCLLRHGAIDVSHHDGERLRYRALHSLERYNGVLTNFIIRESSVFIGSKEPDKQARYREEYVSNMVNSDYILCCRGSANYSFRLYETLCMGRIPVVIDTDCRFPYDFHVDWRDHCVLVDRDDLPSVGHRVLDHYQGLSSDAYLDRQIAARRFWEDYVSPLGFFRRFSKHLGAVGPQNVGLHRA